jgi:hypothetical protein
MQAVDPVPEVSEPDAPAEERDTIPRTAPKEANRGQGHVSTVDALIAAALAGHDDG